MHAAFLGGVHVQGWAVFPTALCLFPARDPSDGRGPLALLSLQLRLGLLGFCQDSFVLRCFPP